MKTTENPTCENLIDKHLQSRLEELFPNFDEMTPEECKDHIEETTNCCNDHNLDDFDEEEWQQEAETAHREAIWERPLSIERITTVKILLSWGGPSDEFQIDLDSEGYVIGGRYLYRDWFDGARRELTGQQAQDIAELFAITEM